MEMLFDQPPRRSRSKSLPEALIYEILDGKPIYRKGYRQVLNGTKTLEEIMPASTLQSAILSILLRLIFQHYDDNDYFILTNEPGLHLSKRINLAGDILIFDKKILRPEDINQHYAKVPAQVHIEVDIEADTEDMGDMEYVTKKTRRLLAFGTKRVIWIFTSVKSILLAEPDRPWQTLEWRGTVEIGNGATFNLEEQLKKQGIKI
ncbi:MAG: Uma2 family endonuclease [Saprospiraceae bacterium]|nr:Uma2 family endonuclease [Lewinellaceae bacterium]